MPTVVFYSLSAVRQYLTLYRLLVLCHYVHCCLTVVFYSLSAVCQYLTLYSLLVLCHYVHCYLLQSVHCLPIPHTVQSVGSVSICPLLCFYSLSTVCQYLTLYRLLVLCQYVHCCILHSVHCLSVPHTVQSLVLCHYVHCCLLQSVHCLSVPHTVPSVGSMSLCPLLSSKVCPLSANTSHCTVCWFCINMSTAVFLQSVHCLSVPHTVPSVGSVSICPLLHSTFCPRSVSTSHRTVFGSVSLCPLLSSTVCPLSVSTSHCTVCWFCVNMSTAAFYILSTVCQYLTPYRLMVLYQYVHCCVSTVCPLSVSTSHCTVGWFYVTMSTAVFYSLSTVCQYHTLYSLLFLCHYVRCCLLQSVHCLSEPHTVLTVGSVSPCPLLPSTVCPLSVSTSHCTVCWFCVSMSTVTFYSMSTISQYLTLYRLLVLYHCVHCCSLSTVC